MEMEGSDHLHGPASAALAADHLPALLGPHACSEADLPDAFSLAELVGIVHVVWSYLPAAPGTITVMV
jgi:hypothetical protein